jgi:hypothetical protein
MDLKGLGLLGAVAAACLAVAGGTARADFIPGCGQGFTLTQDPVTEQALVNGNGNVNNDGWVCIQNNASPHGLFNAVDNNVHKGAKG